MVPQHIGNAGTKATAWVERITLSLSPQVKRAKELEEFTERFGSLFDLGEPLDVTTRTQMEAFFGYSLERVFVHRGHLAEEASRRLGARAFTFRGHIFAPQQNLDASTTEGLGLLAHELTHAIQQTQPHRLPQGQMADQGTRSVPAAPTTRSRSDAEMVLLAPAKSASLTASPQLREAQAQASEQLAVEGSSSKVESPPQINPEAVANEVYRLMQYDLFLERERRTKLGG